MISLRSAAAVAVMLSLAIAGSLRAQAVKRQPAGTQIAAVPAEPIEDRAAIVDLEHGGTTALTRRDRSYFERVLDPDFIYTADDRVMSRTQVISDLLAANDTVTSADNEDLIVHMFGQSAVATGILRIGGKPSDRPFVRRYRFTHTWMKKANGTWRIVAAQTYRLPARP